MADYQPVSPSTYANMRWNRDPTLRFTAGFTTAVLTITELPRAALALPIGFVEQDASFTPVAVLGFEKGKNLFFDPATGWNSPFVPAVFATHPFKIGKTGEQYILCVDRESDQLSETSGEPFFLDNGELGPTTRLVADLLKESERAYAATRQACAFMKKANIIRPWDITIKTEIGESKPSGFFRVDEAALNSASAEELVELRRTGALMMAYCQMLSSQHLTSLGRRVASTRSVAQASQHSAPAAVDSIALGASGTFNFGALR